MQSGAERTHSLADRVGAKPGVPDTPVLRSQRVLLNARGCAHEAYGIAAIIGTLALLVSDTSAESAVRKAAIRASMEAGRVATGDLKSLLQISSEGANALRGRIRCERGEEGDGT
jgi:hypothetical protein